MLLIIVIEVPVSRVIAVIRYPSIRAPFIASLVDRPPGERSAQMFRQTKRQSVFIGCLLPTTADILMGTNFHRIEPVEAGWEVKKVIVMGRLPDKIAGARFDIQVHQPIRVKLFRLPQCAQVFIAEY